MSDYQIGNSERDVDVLHDPRIDLIRRPNGKRSAWLVWFPM
jgi:hypothetical protein